MGVHKGGIVMSRKFKVNGKEYSSLKFTLEHEGLTSPITITFTKHDIGTWNACIEEIGDWVHANTKEEALFQLMIKYFGQEIL